MTATREASANRVCVGVRRRVVPFEAPGRERRALRSVVRAVAASSSSLSDVTPTRLLSVSVADPRVFQFLCFSLSPDGVRLQPKTACEVLSALTVRADSLLSLEHPERVVDPDSTSWSHDRDAWCQYTTATLSSQSAAAHTYVVLVTFRPTPLLPFCWPSARRAVRFVHGVVALVTANAYISTLGGGHFLCRHLDRATLMAKMQMAVSVGLQDPVLESKCRVNLAYNALQAGRFARARRIIDHETRVAEQLDNDELRKVSRAAGVYLAKTYRLHLEFKQRNRAALLAHADGIGGSGSSTHHLHDNFYRQRIVKRRDK
jgi:hypothetical protein